MLLQGVLAHPYYWRSCAHPTQGAGKHKSPQPTEDLQFELRDTDTNNVTETWVPGQQYSIVVSAPVEFQAMVTITGGVLPSSHGGLLSPALSI